MFHHSFALLAKLQFSLRKSFVTTVLAVQAELVPFSQGLSALPDRSSAGKLGLSGTLSLHGHLAVNRKRFMIYGAYEQMHCSKHLLVLR
jgi:hypothetical protein